MEIEEYICVSFTPLRLVQPQGGVILKWGFGDKVEEMVTLRRNITNGSNEIG